jgi:hypothetical protein
MLLLATVLAPYSAWSRLIANLSDLYWTCGLLMFVIHLYFGVFTIFDGFADTVQRVGAWAVTFNCFLIGWWSLDVTLIWLYGQSHRGIWLAHAAAQIFVFLVFAGGLVSHDGPVQNLGLLFVMGVLASLAIRLVLPDRPVKAYSRRYGSKRCTISMDVGCAHGECMTNCSWDYERLDVPGASAINAAALPNGRVRQVSLRHRSAGIAHRVIDRPSGERTELSKGEGLGVISMRSN